MVSLYHDPMGEKIFGMSNPASMMDLVQSRSGMLTRQVMDTESEQVTKLQNRMNELESLQMPTVRYKCWIQRSSR